MPTTVNSIKTALKRTWDVTCSVLDVPAKPLRTVAQTTWEVLPTRLQNWANKPGYLPREANSVVATALIAAKASAAYGLSAAAGWPLTLAAGAIVGRAAYLTRTGLDLPDKPILPLIETVAKIEAFQKNAGLTVHHQPPRSTSTTPVKNQIRIEADQQAKALVKNASIFITVSFIQGRLGLEVSQNQIIEIIKESQAPGASLWTSYLKHLGGKLTFSQLIRAGFWYLLTYKIGLIPNSINLFATNVLKEIRAHIAGERTELEPGVDRLLTQIGQFLDVYNQATKEYAEIENPTVSIHEYRQERLRQLGGTSLEKLCEDSSKILVDEFFHDIPLFEGLKQTPSLWVFEILSRPLEWLVNNLARLIMKRELPTQLRSIVEKGIDAASPQNLPFAFAITDSLNTSLSRLLHDEKPSSETPLSFQPEKLPEVVDKLITALSLTGEKKNPLDTQDKISAYLKTQQSNSRFWAHTPSLLARGLVTGAMTRGISVASGLSAAVSWPLTLTVAALGGAVETRPDKWAREKWGKIREWVENEIVKKIMVEGGKMAIASVAHNAEEMIADLLEACNRPFKQEGTVVTKELYEQRCQDLEITANSLFQKIIGKTLEGPQYEELEADFNKVYNDQKQSLDASIDEFSSFARFILETTSHRELRIHLNNYMKAIEDFINYSPAKLVDNRPNEMKEVKKAFYESYYPMYLEVSKLADRLLEVQKLQNQTELYNAKATRYQEILNELHCLHRNIENPDAIANFEQKMGGDCINLVYSLKSNLTGKPKTPQMLREQINRYIARIQSEPRTARTPGRGERPEQLAAHAASDKRLRQSIQKLQIQTNRIASLGRSIKPARLEGNSSIFNLGIKKTFVPVGAKVGMTVFNKALQLITQHHGIYDGLARVTMSGLTKGYQRR